MKTRFFEFIYKNCTIRTTHVNVVLIIITGALDGLKMSSSLWQWQSSLTGTHFARLFFNEKSIFIP